MSLFSKIRYPTKIRDVLQLGGKDSAKQCNMNCEHSFTRNHRPNGQFTPLTRQPTKKAEFEKEESVLDGLLGLKRLWELFKLASKAGYIYIYVESES